jgi:hypothetical protein
VIAIASKKSFNFFFAHFLRMTLIMKYDVAFNSINVAFFRFVRIMFGKNDITDLFKQFCTKFFHRMIFRKILDIILIWHDIQKVSRYHRRIYRKILDIILYRVDIQKVCLIYPLQAGYPESFRIINS